MPTTVATYTNLPGTIGGPLSLRRSGQSRFALPDLQGNVRQLTDSAQTVTDTLTTDAFGVQKASTGSTVNPYKAFGGWGYFTDTPSRLYVRRRHLRVDLGGWLSRDPIPTARVSPYLYAGNNPATYLDPTGALQWVPYDFPNWSIGSKPSCCGAYDARWIAGFDHNRSKQNQYGNAPCTGYIIQKVIIYRELACPSTWFPSTISKCYFEIVGNLKGVNSGEFHKGDNPYPRIADVFSWGGAPGNSGRSLEVGVAKLFCNVTETDLKRWGFKYDCLGDPTHFYTNRCVACNSGDPNPPWWTQNDPGKPPEKPSPHFAASKWNCCDECKPDLYSNSVASPPADQTTKPC